MPGTVLLGSRGGSTGRRVPRGGGTVQFRILGPLEVLDGQRRVELGRPKQRALLAVLLVHANQVVALDRLIEELWGEQPPAQATASLQAYVSNLRRVLEPDRPARTLPRVLVTQPPGYRLVVAPGDLDAARFVALAEEGHRLLEAERARAGRPGVAGGAGAVARAGPGRRSRGARSHSPSGSGWRSFAWSRWRTAWPPSWPLAGMPRPPPSSSSWLAAIRSGSACMGC